MKIFPELDNSDSENDNKEFGNINPDLINFDIVPHQESHYVPIPTSIVETLLLLNNQFCEKCSQLNSKQRERRIFYEICSV